MRIIIVGLFCLILFLKCHPALRQSAAPDFENEPFVFAVIGDFGKPGAGRDSVAAMVKSWKPEFIITLGDNNYNTYSLEGMSLGIGADYKDFIYNPDAPKDYQSKGRASKEKLNRFFPSIGNHDMQRKTLDKKVYLDYFTLPGKELYYDFVWGDVHLFALNSNPRGQVACCTSEQAQWLKEGLEKSTATFKLVYFHHPPFSPGFRKPYKEMRWPFEEWGASAVITGHNHVYARITKKSNPEGIPYIVNGLGGARKYVCATNQLAQEKYNVFCYNEHFGAIRAMASKSQLVLDFIAVDHPNDPVDRVILKPPAPKAPQNIYMSPGSK